MRRHQADKADAARYRYRCAHATGGAGQHQQAQLRQADAHGVRGFLAERQRLQATARLPQQQQAEHDQGHAQRHFAHAAIRQRAHHPEHDFLQRKGIARPVHHQRNQRAAQRGNRHAGQDQRGGVLVALRQQQHQQHRQCGTGHAGQRQRQRSYLRQPGIERNYRAQRGPAGHAQQAGFRQRVAQQALQRGTGHAQRRPYRHAQHGARQAQIPEDAARHPVAGQHALQQAQRRHVHVANRQRQQAQRQQHQPGQQPAAHGPAGPARCGRKIGNSHGSDYRSWRCCAMRAAVSRLQGPPQIVVRVCRIRLSSTVCCSAGCSWSRGTTLGMSLA